jgi:hypothetical protein
VAATADNPGCALSIGVRVPQRPPNLSGKKGDGAAKLPPARTRGAKCLVVMGVGLVRMCPAPGPGSSCPWSFVRRPQCRLSAPAALVRVIYPPPLAGSPGDFYGTGVNAIRTSSNVTGCSMIHSSWGTLI